MSVPTPTAPEPPNKIGPVTETNLGWAEQRHAMLARLAALGMRLAEEIVERAINSPYHPEPRHEPGRAYANAARAVRFSLVLQARVEQQIIAMRKGLPIPQFGLVQRACADVSGAILGETAARSAAVDSPSQDLASEARDTEPTDHSRERLTESETYDDMLNRPMAETVEGICADLGVPFDASLWSDEVSAGPVDTVTASAPTETSSRDRPRPSVYPANTHELTVEGIPPRFDVTSREPERIARRE